ncbi:hypothetical protein LXT21_13585 [Myxococcus sp. K38C18041901]|uniref:hypothetical protein n=1 Tax=Myxococcus guangdongensis TaxID=2906760 RepID=UPI0020A6DB90|nr:hypothetical protein [Myxococcus guangdongensis]MCP3059811.1 hypothetical protein [Myxococcus guangdongensis]
MRMQSQHTLLMSVVVAGWLLGCQRAEAPPSEERVVSHGHGAFIGESGKVLKADLGLVRRTQKELLERLRGRALERGGIDLEAPRKLIDSQVEDEVLADALYIEWLNDTLRTEEVGQVRALNNALRMHYLEDLREPDMAPQELHDTKGVGAQVARKLEAQGITTFATTNEGKEYIRECAAAGVPIPPPMFSFAWVPRGVIRDEFILENLQAELLHYTSTSPPGLCLALPRYRSDGVNIDLLGIICLGTVSNKACFWDSPKPSTFQRGVVTPIEAFKGGAGLVSGTDMCTDCHAGENPFIVHPERPPFDGLATMGSGWYEPLVHPDWPQNAGPSSLLEAVASEGRCDSCHRGGGIAGRFPSLSMELPGYCVRVLQNAVRPAPLGTMPPNGGNRDLYLKHIGVLEAACNAPSPTGVEVPVSFPDDPTFLSPPIVVDPLYACGTRVSVRGAVLDAKVTLRIDGTDVDTLIARNPSQEVFKVPRLEKGQQVTVRQEKSGALSLESPAIPVRDHTADYPAGLPAPAIDPTLIHECSEVISVRHVPNATVTVTVNGGAPVMGLSSSDWTALRPGKTPLEVDYVMEAQISLCDDKSPVSAPQKVVKAPASLPPPVLAPPRTFAGQELVSLSGLTHGTRTELRVPGAGPAGGFSTPVSWFPHYDFATPLGRPLKQDEVLVVQQTLCEKGTPLQSQPAEPCFMLPAPRIQPPLPGTNFVAVTSAIPGARIRVRDASNKEIGDGSGNVILLSRVLVPRDLLTVVQQVGECTSAKGYRIGVREK